MARRYRKNLRSSVAASAAPYGYTLTVWSSGAVAIDQLGKPHLAQILLFMAGAVLAFVLVEVVAYGSLRVRLVSGDAPAIAVWGNAHWVSAGVAILAVWGVDHALSRTPGWAASGFLATGLYLLLNAAQVTAASRVEEVSP